MKYQYYSQVKLLGSRGGSGSGGSSANRNTDGERSVDFASGINNQGENSSGNGSSGKKQKAGKRQIIYKIGDEE